MTLFVRYNEPDSQIYKDALTLKVLANKTCRKLAEEDENAAPDVHAAVQEILTSIFIGESKLFLLLKETFP